MYCPQSKLVLTSKFWVPRRKAESDPSWWKDSKSAKWQTLHPDYWNNILAFTTLKDKLNIRQTCKKLYAILEEDDNFTCKRIMVTYWLAHANAKNDTLVYGTLFMICKSVPEFILHMIDKSYDSTYNINRIVECAIHINDVPLMKSLLPIIRDNSYIFMMATTECLLHDRDEIFSLFFPMNDRTSWTLISIGFAIKLSKSNTTKFLTNPSLMESRKKIVNLLLKNVHPIKFSSSFCFWIIARESDVFLSDIADDTTISHIHGIQNIVLCLKQNVEIPSVYSGDQWDAALKLILMTNDASLVSRFLKRERECSIPYNEYTRFFGNAMLITSETFNLLYNEYQIDMNITTADVWLPFLRFKDPIILTCVLSRLSKNPLMSWFSFTSVEAASLLLSGMETPWTEVLIQEYIFYVTCNETFPPFELVKILIKYAKDFEFFIIKEYEHALVRLGLINECLKIAPTNQKIKSLFSRVYDKQ